MLAVAVAAATALLLSPPPRAGYSVVAEATFGGESAVRAHEAIRLTWPERYGSDSAARKAIRRQLVQDEAGVSLRSGDLAVPGQTIRLIARTSPGPAPGEGRRSRIDTPLDCVYEDDDLAIIFKPAGISVQGGVRAALASGLEPTRYRDERSLPLWRPQHVHRLDAPTSGLLVCAKTGLALRALSAAFAERAVHKRYRAVLAGAVEADEGTLTFPLSGKHARTDYRVVERFADGGAGQLPGGMATLVDFFPGASARS